MSAAESSAQSPESPPDDLLHFMLGVGSWFASFGLHGVLFSTLLVVELRESELRVGLAQSAIMIPAVVLMLAGGIAADHGNRRRMLIGLHAAASTLAATLALALAAGLLSYPLLLAYAVSMGALQAFANPARDALLSDVAGDDLARPVAMMNLTQWGSQALGALAGGLSRIFGAGPFFFVQSAVLAVGVFAFFGVRRTVPEPRPSIRLGQLLDGVREVFRTPALRLSWLLVCAVGVLFIGPFMVVFPLMVRDVFQRGAAEIAFVSTAFPLGTITGSLLIMRAGGLRDLMAGQRNALIVGAVVLIACATPGLPFWGILVGVFVWGMGASVFMIAGRTLFQQRASAENRGRVLATYTMGFMGAAGMFGAPLSGALVRFLGPRGSLAALGATMLVVVAGVSIALRSQAAWDPPGDGV